MMKQRNQKKTVRKVWMDAAYYVVLFILIGIIVMTTANRGKGPKVFLGYSAFIVLSSSMEPEIPKGSLVITKQIDGAALRLGDDITYMFDEETSITHRIVRIESNYQNSGQYAFSTKGIANNQADEKMVYEVNVVGKVIYHSMIFGTIAIFIQRNWPLLLFFMGIFVLFTKVIGYILTDDGKETNHQ